MNHLATPERVLRPGESPAHRDALVPLVKEDPSRRAPLVCVTPIGGSRKDCSDETLVGAEKARHFLQRRRNVGVQLGCRGADEARHESGDEIVEGRLSR